MQTRSLRHFATVLFLVATSCQSSKLVLEPEPVSAGPAVHPFAALQSEAFKDKTLKLSAAEVKDKLLPAFLDADRADGKPDGYADIVKVCAQGPAICNAADLNHDGKLAAYEFWDRVSALLKAADTNHDGSFTSKELGKLPEVK